MTVRRVDDLTVALAGLCGAEDAEPLLQALLATPKAQVDLRGCEGAHTAVIQVLMASQVEVLGPAGSDFLRDMVEPALKGL